MEEKVKPVAEIAVAVATDTPQPSGIRHFLTEKVPNNFVAVAAVAFVMTVILIWFICSYFFTQVTIGNHIYKASLSDTALQSAIEKQVAGYKLTLQYPNKKAQTFTLQEAGMSVSSKASVQAIRHEQRTIKQRMLWWQQIHSNVVVKADSSKLNTFIASHANVIVQPAKDATLGLANGEVKLTEAEPGKAYGLIKPDKALVLASSALSPLPLQLQTLSVSPAISSAELSTSKQDIEKMLNQHVVFSIAGKQVTAKPADISAWLEIGPDKDNKHITVSVNSGKVLEYINKISKPFVHPPKAQIEVTSSDGTQVLVPGQQGIDVMNKNTVATSVTDRLKAGKGIQMDLPISQASFQTITAGDYPKWIEVDITNKRMYAYEHASLQKIFLVTAGAPKTPTVTGQYAIYSKKTQQDMRGRNVDGSRYFQPHVPWVNYFYKDYAIHGNYWRPSSYFGNINSSHGCVSIIPSEAAWIYNWAPVGTPVIVHK
jgi:lipoprotein-anchoring transpeptidase ErfK/SrfK